MRFAQLETAAYDLPFGPVVDLLMAARGNAHYTLHVEKAGNGRNEDELALASLEGLLCFYEGPQSDLDWFKAHGVSW